MGLGRLTIIGPGGGKNILGLGKVGGKMGAGWGGIKFKMGQGCSGRDMLPIN